MPVGPRCNELVHAGSRAIVWRGCLVCAIGVAACNSSPAVPLDGAIPSYQDAAEDRRPDLGNDADLLDRDGPNDAADAPPSESDGGPDGTSDATSDADVEASTVDAPYVDASADRQCIVGRSALGACTLAR